MKKANNVGKLQADNLQKQEKSISIWKDVISLVIRGM